MRWTWALFLILLLGGIGLSIALTLAGLSYGWLFLFLPLVFPPFVMGRRTEAVATAPLPRRCPTCGRASMDSEARFCDRDGTPLP